MKDELLLRVDHRYLGNAAVVVPGARCNTLDIERKQPLRGPGLRLLLRLLLWLLLWLLLHGARDKRRSQHAMGQVKAVLERCIWLRDGLARRLTSGRTP